MKLKVNTVTGTVNRPNSMQETIFNRVAAAPGAEPHLVVGNETAELLDFFGDNFRQLMENYVSQSTPVISQSYLKTLGKVEITVCAGCQPGKMCFDNSTILMDASLQLEMLLPKNVKKQIKFSCVPASFSPIVEGSSVSGNVIRCDEFCRPVTGAAQVAGGGVGTEDRALEALLAASESSSPLILLTRRGGISFAQKALVAQRYLSRGVSVAAVVVVQSVDKWPFVMADSAREIHTNAACASPCPDSEPDTSVVCLSVPIVMISKHDGALLEEYMVQRTGPAASVSVTVQVNGKLNECSICQELMEFPACGQGRNPATDSPESTETRPMEVYKLPCNHCYHVECVTQWLNLHNTCPMCRFKCPAEAAGSASGSAVPVVGPGDVGDMYM